LSLLLSILFLFPLVWAMLNSVKSRAEANQQPPTWFPHDLSIANYQGLATYGEGLSTYAFNSVAVSVITVLMAPYATILLPLYIVLGRLGLQNSLVGLSLVLVMFQLPFSTFMMRNSFESIPRELEESALVDGCNNLTALLNVSLRIVMPGIVTVALFAFLASWNEFLAPLIFLNDGEKYTLPIMLVNIRSGAYGSVDFGALQAGVVVAMVPCLVLYLVLQRFYVSGLVNGALRG